jgi:N-acetylmuramoyl-L-alanine amidase
MKMIMMAMFFFFTSVSSFALNTRVQKVKVVTKPLYGLVVVIDPGHGGLDNGNPDVDENGTKMTPEMCQKNHYCEADYTYPVAYLLKNEVEKNGGLVFLTATKKNGEEVSTIDGKTMVGRGKGLAKRVQYANSVYTKYSKNHKVVFISLHADSLPNPVEGVRIIYRRPYGKLASSLNSSFERAGRLRIRFPVVASGDWKNHGIQNEYILNPARGALTKEAVLIELADLKNARDRYRIGNPEIQKSYANCIVEALLQHIKK